MLMIGQGTFLADGHGIETREYFHTVPHPVVTCPPTLARCFRSPSLLHPLLLPSSYHDPSHPRTHLPRCACTVVAGHINML